MKYYVYCKDCSKEIVLILRDRYYRNIRELSLETGDSFFLTCPNCRKSRKYNITDVLVKTCLDSLACSIFRATTYMISGMLFGTFLSLPIAKYADGMTVWLFSIIGLTLGLLFSFKKDEQDKEYSLNFYKKT